MKVLSVKPGHDGTVAYVRDGELLFSLEAEKDSLPRHSPLRATTFLKATEMAPEAPDVIALSGWHRTIRGPYEVEGSIGGGYAGKSESTEAASWFFGRRARFFTSSHERSHLFCAAALSPEAPLKECVILLWEGLIGAFYHWRDYGHRIRRVPVLSQPGTRYAALFALADPTFSNEMAPRMEDAGKLMALAAFGDATAVGDRDRQTVEALLSTNRAGRLFAKEDYRDSPLFNCEVECQVLQNAARYMTDRLFEIFLDAAVEKCPRGLPLVITGGCGLNCEWNTRWLGSGIFSSVFVPPCCNDSGSAIGTAIEAAAHFGDECSLRWSVYTGAAFLADDVPSSSEWENARLDWDEIAARLARGDVVAWVQGRCEIGPRALGHRSLLASPLRSASRDRLNQMKRRAEYRPIAPCCLEEEFGRSFDGASDPYMLYFSRALTADLPAVTHVDGTARPQSVSDGDGSTLSELLRAFKSITGYGVLCNTSLNFPGHGFINRFSDLVRYCTASGVDCLVVGDTSYGRRQGPTQSHD